MNEGTAQKPTKLSLLSPDLYDLKSSFLTMDTTRRTMIREYTPRKILLLGLSNTGKSSIALKFLYGFPDLAGHGPEENHYTSLKYKNEDYLLHIVDIADLDEYTPLYTSKYSAKVDGYIFVYSLDNHQSFEFIQTLRSKLYDLNQREVPSILVANKSDLKEHREISTEEGKELAKLFRMPYIEVSAHRHSNEFIQRIFEIALKEILKNEDSNRNLKLLKNWDEDRVDLLYHIFMFTSLLASMSGLFFITCSLFFLVVGSEFADHQVAGLIILMISGFLSVALSVFGFLGMRKEEKDWITVSKILIIISFILDVTSLLLRSLCPSIPGDTSELHVIDSSENYKGVYILLYIINYIHILVLAILFAFSWISREIFIKRRNAPSNRFAQLKA